MKKALSLVLALVMMLALTVPAFAVSNTQWKAMKALADWQSGQFIYRETGSGGLGEVLVKNYGYQDRADDYGVSGVTRAHVLAALKDLYPVLSDKAAESLLNEPFNNGWLYKEADGTYYVQNDLGFGGGGRVEYVGYTEDNDVFSFYYGEVGCGPQLDPENGTIVYDGVTYTAPAYSVYCNADGEGLNMYTTFIRYNDEDFVVDGGTLYYLPTAEDLSAMVENGMEYYMQNFSLYTQLQSFGEITVNGVTYYAFGDGSVRAFTLPTSDAELAALAAKSQKYTGISLSTGNAFYYGTDTGSYVAHLGGEPLTDPFIPKTMMLSADNPLFFYNGSYYILTPDNAGELLTEIPGDNIFNTYYYVPCDQPFCFVAPTWEGIHHFARALEASPDSLEYEGKTFRKTTYYSSMELVSEKGVYLVDVADTIEYKGVTYYSIMGHFHAMPDFGHRVIFETQNGEVTKISLNDENNKFPASMKKAFGVDLVAPAGVMIETDDGVFEEGTVVTAKVVETGKVADLVKKTVGTIAKKYVIFDFSAEKDGVPVQPNGKVKVSMPLPAVLSPEHLKLFYVSDSGAKEEIAVTYDKATNTVTAELEHFSTYVLANVTPSPQTGDNGNMILWISLLSACLFGTAWSVVAIRRAKNRA